jgi:hypothetical protein
MENDFKDINSGTLHLANYKNAPGFTWAIVIDRDCELQFKITPNGRSYSIKADVGSSGSFSYKEEIVMLRGAVETVLATIATDTNVVPTDNSWYTYYPPSAGGGNYPTSGNYSFEAGDFITIRATITCNTAPPTLNANYHFRFDNNSAYQWQVKIFDRLETVNIIGMTGTELFQRLLSKMGTGFGFKSDALAARPTLIVPAEACRDDLAVSAITRTSLERRSMPSL